MFNTFIKIMLITMILSLLGITGCTSSINENDDSIDHELFMKNNTNDEYEQHESIDQMTSSKVSVRPSDVFVKEIDQLMIDWTIDELITGADTILIGEVVEILPAVKEESQSRSVIYTDIVIAPEQYFFTDYSFKRIVVRVEEGRVGNMVMLNEDEPSFTLGERCFLTLYRPPYTRIPPNGYSNEQYYVVAGCFKGKYTLSKDILKCQDGSTLSIRDIELKVASLRNNPS